MNQTFFHSLDNLMHQIKTLVKFIGHFFFGQNYRKFEFKFNFVQIFWTALLPRNLNSSNT